LDVDWGFDSIYHAEGDAENRPDIIDLWNSKVHLRKAISPPPVAGSTHYTKLLHDKALEFINRNDSKPFFAWIAHRAPHQQSLIGTNLENQSAAWRRLRPPSEPIYNTAQMPMVLNPAKGNDTLQTKPPQQLGFASRYFYNFVAENIGIKEYHRRAFEQIDYLDKQIGVLVEQLRVANKLDNTLIVFLSDNGVFLGERGMQGKGPFNYDEITRVPLVFWWPGRVPAATRNALVQSTDLIQTLAEAAQTPKVPGTNSSSFWPVVSGSAEDRHRTSVFFQYHSQKNIITQIRGVLKNGWKFSHYLASNSYVNVDGASNTEKVPLVPYSPLSFELYNLNADPNELTNRLPYERGELDALRKATLDPNQRPKINDLLRTMSEYQTISQDPTGVIVTDILVTRTGPETATLTWKSKKGQNPLAASTEVVYRKKDCLSCPTFEIDHKSLSSDHSVNLSGLQQNVAYEAMAFSISATANGGFARVIIPATQGTGWVGGGNPFISYVWQNFNTQVISYQQPPSIETKTCQIFGANGGVIGQWQIGRKYCVDVCRELQNTNPNRSCRWGEDIFHFAESSLCLVPISEPNTREYTSLYQCREKCRAQSPSSTCKWGAFTINP
jgi:arylsulfatase A-like enzyme